MTDSDRSMSRGRDTAFKSTGRGGAGNIRQQSVSRTRPETGPSDFSNPRGREPLAGAAQKGYSTGRGGAGNLQFSATNMNMDVSLDAVEKEIIKERVNANAQSNFSSGRGGIGNFLNRSRSRDPAAAPPAYSTGRGGSGNIVASDIGGQNVVDEEERRRGRISNEGYRSTGRGGSANFVHGQAPPVEQPHHDATAPTYESTGRGGAGNITRERSQSRQRS